MANLDVPNDAKEILGNLIENIVNSPEEREKYSKNPQKLLQDLKALKIKKAAADELDPTDHQIVIHMDGPGVTHIVIPENIDTMSIDFDGLKQQEIDQIESFNSYQQLLGHYILKRCR